MNSIKRLYSAELPYFLSIPALLWQFLFLYLPLVILLFNSFIDKSLQFPFTFSFYQKIFNPLYFKVIFSSFILALSTACICLLVAYPVAYFIALKVKRYKTLFLFLLILPSWTSFVVQVYAWFFLLKKDGFIILFFQKMGLFLKLKHLLNNYFAIQVGMVYCFLPFMILPIFTVLEKMDKSLLEASSDLGAGKFQTFKRIIFPLSFPGVVVGFLLVFIPSFGEFAVPDLLGGGKKVLWGSVIVDKFLISREWETGSSLTVIGILTLLVVFSVVYFSFNFLRKIVKTKI